MKLTTAESILLPLQRLQKDHDEAAHRDILHLDLYSKLKHMVLHFYKYSGKIQLAYTENDLSKLYNALIDTFIICMASANAMNLSLGKRIHCCENIENIDSLAIALSKKNIHPSPFLSALESMLIIGGKMAKTIESSDHMEHGNPRVEMEALIPELSVAILSTLGKMDGLIEKNIQTRFHNIEKKSIFYRNNTEE